MIDMTHPQTTTRSTPMPEAMRVLLQDYPRDSWQAHPGFHEKTRHWLGAHQMFDGYSLDRIRLAGAISLVR